MDGPTFTLRYCDILIKSFSFWKQYKILSQLIIEKSSKIKVVINIYIQFTSLGNLT